MGFFFMENPIKMEWFGGAPIFRKYPYKDVGWDGMRWDESQSIMISV